VAASTGIPVRAETNDRVSRRRVDRLADFTARNSLLIVAIAVLAAAMLAVAPELLVADSWMTLVAGREIVEHGLPSREALTVMPLGERWVDQQWLAQLVFYGTERLGGLRSALLLDVALVVLAFASAAVASRLRGASAQSTLFASAAAMIVAPWAWQLRAQSFALPLFTWVLALIALDPRLLRRRTWLVFPLLVLWANLHGSVILGASIVSLAGLVGLGNAVLRRPSPGKLRVGALLALPWACVLASPYAVDLPGYYRLLLVDSPVSKVIVEWQAPKPEGWMIAFFVFAAVTAVIAVWKHRSLSVFDLGVLALTLGGALRSGRGIVWFVLAVAVLLPVAMDALLGGDRSPIRRRLGIGLAVGFVALALAAFVSTTVLKPASWFTQRWPNDVAARTIADASAAAGRKAVWPSDKHTDWLLWRLPELRGRVAYDVRFELVTSRQLESIVRYKSLQPGWEDPTRGYRLVVVDLSDTPRHPARLTDLGARILYRDGDVVVLSLPSA
jgi:hypothetical protein